MERLQHEWTKRGVIWLTVVSSAPGAQGYDQGEENAYLERMKAAPTAAIISLASSGISTTPRPLRTCL